MSVTGFLLVPKNAGKVKAERREKKEEREKVKRENGG